MSAMSVYSIGGVNMAVVGGETRGRVAAMRCFSPFLKADKTSGEVTVRTDVVLALPEYRCLHRFDIMEGASECCFGIDAEGVYWFSFGSVLRLRYDMRCPHEVAIGSVADPNLLRFVMWVAYSLSALPLGAVPIHASVVVCEGRAVLCLGESGTGKSTHTRLWCQEFEGCYVLNDDSPVARVEGDRVMAYGSPWSGKNPIYNPACAPVAGLLRIEQRLENTIERLGTLEAFVALQPSCPPALAHDEHTMDFIVGFVGDVISRVPVYRLGCRPDAESACLSHQTLFPCN